MNPFNPFIEFFANQIHNQIFILSFAVVDIFQIGAIGYRTLSATQAQHIQSASIKQESTGKFIGAKNLPFEQNENNTYWLSELNEFHQADLTVLEKQITVEGSTNIHDAQILMFGETHGDIQAKTINWQIINKLAKPGDVILIESFEKRVDLIEIITEKVANLLKDEHKWAEANKPLLKNAGVLPLNGVDGYGWDLALDNQGDGFEGLPYFMWANANSKGIAARNLALAQIIEKLDCKRIFVIAGAAHLPTSKMKSTGLTKETFQDLDKALFNKSYALVVPTHLVARLDELPNSFSAGIASIIIDSLHDMESIFYCYTLAALAKGNYRDFGIIIGFKLYDGLYRDIPQEFLDSYNLDGGLVSMAANALLSFIILEVRAISWALPNRVNQPAFFGTLAALATGVAYHTWSGLSQKTQEMRSQELDLSHLDSVCSN